MLKRWWRWVRFGKIIWRIKDQIEGTVCEVEYRGRGNKVIGYWAYGYWQPDLPYQGG